MRIEHEQQAPCDDCGTTPSKGVTRLVVDGGGKELCLCASCLSRVFVRIVDNPPPELVGWPVTEVYP